MTYSLRKLKPYSQDLAKNGNSHEITRPYSHEFIKTETSVKTWKINTSANNLDHTRVKYLKTQLLKFENLKMESFQDWSILTY